MNHLEYGFSGKNHVWRYIVMAVAIMAAINTVGAIPLLIAMALKATSDPAALTGLEQNPTDMGMLGLDPNTTLIITFFPFIVGLVTFMLLVKPLNERTVTGTINGTSKVRWNRMISSALIWFILSAIYLFVQKSLSPEDFVLNNIGKTLIPVIIISLIFIPFQAAFEEMLFRGYLMQGFAVLTRNRWAPVLITSLLFGFLHAWNPEVKEYGFLTMMPQYVLFGLVFGIATIIDDGIEIALGAHAANNIFLCIMVTNKNSAIQTPAVFEQTVLHPWGEFAGLLVSTVVFLMILKYLFKWGSFKTLFSKIDRSIQNN